MVIYFTTNDNYYSKLLKWVFKEPTSHVGVCLYPTGVTPVVVDCTKPYGKIYAFRAWTKKHDPVYAVQIPMALEHERYCFDTVALRSVLRPYDFSAYFYGFYWGLRWRLFGSTLPKRNKKSDHERDLCTEIFNPIKDILQKYGIDLFGVDLAAVTPHMLAKEIYRQTKDNSSITWIGEKLDTLSP
jgi:hypothetical protein